MDGSTYNSLELRWFMPGQVPDRIIDVFASPLSSTVEEWRIDSYWPLSRGDVGVKRRNGGPVEMKVRRSARPWRHPNGPEGVTEQWNKWRPNRLDLDGRDAEWIEVHKHVLTRTFALAGREVSGQVDGRRPRCEVEIAQLSVGAAEWWTVAFEATGPARVQPFVLWSAFESVWSPELSSSVDGGLNVGYPQWLEGQVRPVVSVPARPYPE
jgi:hypothetical protein